MPEGGTGAPFIGGAGRFLSLETRLLAALLGVCFVQAPQLQAPACDLRDSLLLYIEDLHASSIARFIGGYLRLSAPQFLNPQLWLETTRLPYAGYDHTLAK